MSIPWTDRNCEVWVYQTPCDCDGATVVQEEAPAYIECHDCARLYHIDKCRLVANQDIHYETTKSGD